MFLFLLDLPVGFYQKGWNISWPAMLLGFSWTLFLNIIYELRFTCTWSLTSNRRLIFKQAIVNWNPVYSKELHLVELSYL